MRRFASLRRPGDFARVCSRGRRTNTADLTIFRNDAAVGEVPLVGFSVSKSVGGAVVRNRVRRRLSAAVGEILPSHARIHAVIIARPSAAAVHYDALREQLRRALA